MIHEQLDIARWVQEFPLSKRREEAKAAVPDLREHYHGRFANEQAVEDYSRRIYSCGEIIVTPEDIAINHQLRAEAVTAIPYGGRKTPTDVFVWGLGEPRTRACTKIGGLPYWPAGEPWPAQPNGDPIRFIAQFCFADSLDLAGELPGDVLLILGDEEALCCPEQLTFKWQPLQVGELVQSAPVTADPLSPLYGVRFRIEDWPDSVGFLDENYDHSERLAVMEGTKIAGCPSWIQGEADVEGRFLASLGSIADGSHKWPFVNFEGPREALFPNGDLMIGDMGIINLFLDSGGKVNPVIQCY